MASVDNNVKKSFFYLDMLSVISAFAVVMLHNNLIIWSYPSGRLWITANFIDSFFYFAVPVFFMITGVTLCDFGKRSTLKKYFHRRFMRSAVPFIVFSTIAFFTYAKWNYSDLASWRFYKQLFLDVIQYRYMYVYWFFIPLFAIYLALPVLTRIENKVKTYTYMIIYGGATCVVVPFICGLLKESPVLPELTSPITGSYLLYILIGYVLHNTALPRWAEWCIYILGIAGFTALFWGTIVYTPVGGPFCGYFRGYMNLPAILQASALFLFIKNINWDKAPVFFKSMIEYIRPHTLGIYLLHMFVINEIFAAYPKLIPSIWSRTFGSIAVFMICLFASKLIAQIPFAALALGQENPQWFKRRSGKTK